MTNHHLTSTSKFLSLVLRHQPEVIGLVLDSAGWASVDELIAKAAQANRPVTRALLEEVVRTSDKRRFALSEDGLRIRANQGHSVEVELGLPAAVPPDLLYHGTAKRFLEAILGSGLERRSRHHVHLTESLSIANAVGQRYGAVALLQVDSRRMATDGFVFFKSANEVWLTDAVPAAYLQVLSEEC